MILLWGAEFASSDVTGSASGVTAVGPQGADSG